MTEINQGTPWEGMSSKQIISGWAAAVNEIKRLAPGREAEVQHLCGAAFNATVAYLAALGEELPHDMPRFVWQGSEVVAAD